jgi:hypothetical protein
VKSVVVRLNPVVNDTFDEPDETIVVGLVSPTNASLGTLTTHTRTIRDNDRPASPTTEFVEISPSLALGPIGKQRRPIET